MTVSVCERVTLGREESVGHGSEIGAISFPEDKGCFDNGQTYYSEEMDIQSRAIYLMAPSYELMQWLI